MQPDLLASVETRMMEAIEGSTADQSVVTRAAMEHVIAGGSRVRVRLSLHASSRLALGTADSVVLAAVCELLHNASLIQDDLLDRSSSRRASPTVWAKHGDAVAVCAGDLLLASAFALIGELSSTNCFRPVLSLVHRRTRDVILGQGAEHLSEPDTLKDYEAMAVAKSASLLSLPLELPLLVSGYRESLPGAQRAAKAFATAYQMADDLADYAEDMQRGALNAVSVALRSGCPTFDDACALVLNRMEEVLFVLFKEAQALPFDCGAAMVDYANAMRANGVLEPELAIAMTGSARDDS